jgi:hypothetical protein
VPAIIFGEVIMKTRLQKFHHTVHHTNLKAANLRFVPGNYLSRVNSTIFEVRAGIQAYVPWSDKNRVLKNF